MVREVKKLDLTYLDVPLSSIDKLIAELKKKNILIKKIVRRADKYYILSDSAIYTNNFKFKNPNIIEKNLLDHILLLVRRVILKHESFFSGYSRLRESGFKFMLSMALVRSNQRINIVEIGSDDGEEIEFLTRNFLPMIESYTLYEPIERHRERVYNILNKSMLKKFSIMEGGIGFDSAISCFYENSEQPNLSVFVSDNEKIGKTSKLKKESIRKVLSSFEKKPGPLLIVMDVEGQEAEILKGVLRYLDENSALRISICFELHQLTYIKESDFTNTFTQLVMNHGFKIILLEGAGVDHPESIKKSGLDKIFTCSDRSLFHSSNSETEISWMASGKTELINYYPYISPKNIRSALISNYL